MSEQLLRATYSEYYSLIESAAWRDVVNEVNTWLQDVRDKLEVTDDISEMKRFQGIAEACRHFITLPQTILDALEAERGREEQQ